MTDSPDDSVPPDPTRQVSWAGFLLFLFVVLILSDIGSMFIGMLRPAVRASAY